MTEQASNRLEELIRERARLDAELESHQQLVTILFADIVGSTRFFDERGDLAGLVMVQKVLDTLIPLIEEHDGVIAKTIGDAVMAWFRNGQMAVRCGIAMQRAMARRNTSRPPADQIRIRVALNLGFGLIKERDVFGDVVNVASRIEKAADADEIAISPSVFEQVQHLPDIKVRTKATGVQVKGKAETLNLYAVIWREGEAPGPAPPRPSSQQLALATGLHANLEQLARPEPSRAPSPRSAESTHKVTPAPPPPSGPRGTAMLGVKEEEKPAAAGLRFVLVQVRPDGSLGQRHLVDRPGLVLGREKGHIRIPGDAHLAPEHARFTQLGDTLYVEDLTRERGLYRRLRAPHTLQAEETVMLGRTRFRFLPAGAASADAGGSSPRETQILGATTEPAAPACLEELGEGDRVVKRFPLTTEETTFGRSRATCTFPDDRYMSGLHARLTRHADNYVLEDLNSTNGSYIRLRKRGLLRDGDMLLVGEQLLRVSADSA